MQKKKRTMDKAVIRRSRNEDTEEIMAMLLEMDSSDYLQETWPDWMKDTEDIQMTALVGGRIAGCVHGRISAGQDAWAQGLRVRADFRRRGIATSLITDLEEELRRKGARTVFATISRFNQPSLATVAGLNWKIFFPIIRRRLKTGSRRLAFFPQQHVASHRPSPDLHAVQRIVRLSGVPASRRAAAFFKRVYFSMTEEFLREALVSGVVRANTSPAAVAVLDPEPTENKGLWVVALAGAVSGLLGLIGDLAAEAACKELDLVADSPDDPEIQAVLDDLGFVPPGTDEQFMVVEKDLLV